MICIDLNQCSKSSFQRASSTRRPPEKVRVYVRQVEPTSSPASEDLSSRAAPSSFCYCKAPVYVVMKEWLLWQCDLTEYQNASKIGGNDFFKVSFKD